jgi:hypothetical protein
VNDFRGLIFGKGDLIAYPVRTGSRMWMNIATVDEVLSGKLRVSKPDGSTTYVFTPERCAILGRN